MGKRSNMERLPRDFYKTPVAAVRPLVTHLPQRRFTYGELCAGDGDLIDALTILTNHNAECIRSMDIEPQNDDIETGNCLAVGIGGVAECEMLITNPPFKWDMLKPILDLHPKLKPTWLLLPSDFAFNKRSAPYMRICKKVVPVGRVKWFEDSDHSSADNFCWYLFDASYEVPTILVPRDAA